jgi:branched-chain amino acid transport system substrate-binding protein
MMTRRIHVLSLVLLIGAILLGGGCGTTAPTFECTDAIGCVTLASDEPINIGVIQALSGGPSVIGQEQVNSVDLAIAQRNSELLGHPITTQVEDEGCSPEGGANAALRVLSNPQTVAILGTTCSSATAAASRIASDAGLVMLSGASGAPALTTVGGEAGRSWYPGFLRTSSNGAFQGAAVASFILNELGIDKAASLNNDEAYSTSLTNVFDAAFTDMDGELTISAAMNDEDTNMRPVLTAIVDSEAEALFVPLSSSSTQLNFVVEQARDMEGMEDVVLVGVGSFALMQDRAIKEISEDATGIYLTAPAPIENAAYDELVATYEEQYGEVPQRHTFVYAYDATNMLLDALAAVAVQEADGTLHIGRQALRDALYATEDFAGVMGSLSCNAFGDCGRPVFDVMLLEDPAAGLEGLMSNVVYSYSPGSTAGE